MTALGPGWGANAGPQIHDGLIAVSRALSVKQRGGKGFDVVYGPTLVNSVSHRKMAAVYPKGIPIEGRDDFLKRHGSDGRRRVWTYSGKG